MKNTILFDLKAADRIIVIAWDDRTSIDAISSQFGISEQQVIELMRREMKLSSFMLWRKRVQGLSTKHSKPIEHSSYRFKCNRQRNISANKISKRVGI